MVVHASAPIRLGGAPQSGVAVGGRLWVLVDRGGVRRVVEVDPARRRPTGRAVDLGPASPEDDAAPAQRRIPPPPPLVAAGSGLWTVDAAGEAVRIDPATARVTVRVPIRGSALGAGHGGLWALDGVDAIGSPAAPRGYLHRLLRLDPVSGAVTGAVTVGPGIGAAPFAGIAVGRDRAILVRGPSTYGWSVPLAGGPGDGRATGRAAAWAGRLFEARGGGTVLTWDGGRVTGTMTVAGSPFRFRQALVVGPDRAAWVLLRATGGRGAVAWRRLDGTGPARIAVVGSDPVSLVAVPQGVWVVDRAAGTLSRVPDRP